MTFHPFEGLRFSLSQNEFSQTLLYKKYACFNVSNSSFSKLCSPFLRVHVSVLTLFGLQAKVKQVGGVRKR